MRAAHGALIRPEELEGGRHEAHAIFLHGGHVGHVDSLGDEVGKTAVLEDQGDEEILVEVLLGIVLVVALVLRVVEGIDTGLRALWVVRRATVETGDPIVPSRIAALLGFLEVEVADRDVQVLEVREASRVHPRVGRALDDRGRAIRITVAGADVASHGRRRDHGSRCRGRESCDRLVLHGGCAGEDQGKNDEKQSEPFHEANLSDGKKTSAEAKASVT